MRKPRAMARVGLLPGFLALMICGGFSASGDADEVGEEAAALGHGVGGDVEAEAPVGVAGCSRCVDAIFEFKEVGDHQDGVAGV